MAGPSSVLQTAGRMIRRIAMPSRSSASGIVLRPLRVRDCRTFAKAAGQLTGSGIPGGMSGMRLWWWLRRRFEILYCIEALGRPCGVIGLYDWMPDETARVGLTIFDDTARGRGTGTAAANLFAGLLRKYTPIRRLEAEVHRDNARGMSFWAANGYFLSAYGETTVLFSMQLPPAPGEAPHRS